MPRFKGCQYQIMSLVDDWAGAFEVPRESIERQIPIAHSWCQSNPRKAPKRNVPRFLFNWMSKAKQYGSLGNHKRVSYKEEKPEEDEVMTADDFAAMRKAIRRPA